MGPLVVLTADRPHELRDCGAAQTIDQVRLYGSHVKWFFDLEEPDGTDALVRHARTIAVRAVSTARHRPAGPVHVNCPYREPLIPDRTHLPAGREDGTPRPTTSVVEGARLASAATSAALAEALGTVHRGLVVAGPQDDPALPAAVSELAQALGYPILADPLSGLRCGSHDRSLVLDAYDAFLRDPAFVERAGPEVVLRFGAVPTSKPALQFL